ncbi:MAG TPA: diguanylate cyclase, partial [Desulfobacteraceae bacterium]|nr:diguanylate cyclase [Desulfobacteraceae bacterium]
LCNGGNIDTFDLPVEIRQFEYRTVSEKPGRPTGGHSPPGKRLTRETLLETLHRADWNKAEVGRRVGLSRTAIWKYMKKWDIPLERP